jgi:hypothetical protein
LERHPFYLQNSIEQTTEREDREREGERETTNNNWTVIELLLQQGVSTVTFITTTATIIAPSSASSSCTAIKIERCSSVARGGLERDMVRGESRSRIRSTRSVGSILSKLFGTFENFDSFPFVWRERQRVRDRERDRERGLTKISVRAKLLLHESVTEILCTLLEFLHHWIS